MLWVCWALRLTKKVLLTKLSLYYV